MEQQPNIANQTLPEEDEEPVTEASEPANTPTLEDQDSAGLATELEEARKEASDNYDRYLRVHAEMENYKKRIGRTYADLARSTKKDLLLKLLGVKDNLERALAYGESADLEQKESVMQGVRLTEYQLDQV